MHLKTALLALGGVLIATCANAQATQIDITESDAAKISALIRALYPDSCDAHTESVSDPALEVFTLSWHTEWIDENEPPETARFVKAFCRFGAYNVTHVYFLEDRYDGLLPVHFAYPVTQTSYVDDTQTIVRDVAVTGFEATPYLINTEFDIDTMTVTSFSKSRGLADAFSTGRWVFNHGRFVLKTYSIDPTYDGQQTPITIYDAESGQP